MKAIIKVSGATRSADYFIDTDTREFRRDNFEMVSLERRVGETCKTRYYDPEYRNPQFSGAWCVLIGTPVQIRTNMLDQCPMSLFHAMDIMKALETVGEAETVCLCFEGMRNPNQAIRSSTQYSLYMACQRNIISNLFGVPRESIIQLPEA